MIQKKGKSSIPLFIAIIVIALVVVFGTIYVIRFFANENVKDLQYDMLLVKTKTEMFKSKNTLNKEENPLPGFKLNELPENINIDEFKSMAIITEDEYDKYYLLDSESLEKMDLKELVNKYDGYFIVNYDDYEVIYTKGYENKNKLWCYKISDLEKTPEKTIIQTNMQNVEASSENVKNAENSENTESTENNENAENSEENNN